VWQNETFVVSTSPSRMSDTSPSGVSVTHEEIKQSHSMAVQDEEKQFNPEEEDSQSTVSQDHVRHGLLQAYEGYCY
jgi:hypothetical protein